MTGRSGTPEHVRSNRRASMPLEILHFPLMPLRRRAAVEGAEIAPLAGLGIGLAGVEAVFAGFEFADHGVGTCEAGAGFHALFKHQSSLGSLTFFTSNKPVRTLAQNCSASRSKCARFGSPVFLDLLSGFAPFLMSSRFPGATSSSKP